MANKYAIGALASAIGNSANRLLEINMANYQQALRILSDANMSPDEKQLIIENMPNFLGKGRVLETLAKMPRPQPPDIEGFIKQVGLGAAGLTEQPFSFMFRKFNKPQLPTPQEQMTQQLSGQRGGLDLTPQPEPLPQYEFVQGEGLRQLSPREKTLLQALSIARAPLYGLKSSDVETAFEAPVNIVKTVSETAGDFPLRAEGYLRERTGGETPASFAEEQAGIKAATGGGGESPLIKSARRNIDEIKRIDTEINRVLGGQLDLMEILTKESVGLPEDKAPVLINRVKKLINKIKAVKEIMPKMNESERVAIESELAGQMTTADTLAKRGLLEPVYVYFVNEEIKKIPKEKLSDANYIKKAILQLVNKTRNKKKLKEIYDYYRKANYTFDEGDLSIINNILNDEKSVGPVYNALNSSISSFDEFKNIFLLGVE